MVYQSESQPRKDSVQSLQFQHQTCIHFSHLTCKYWPANQNLIPNIAQKWIFTACLWGSLVSISGSWPSQGAPGEWSCFCGFQILCSLCSLLSSKAYSCPHCGNIYADDSLFCRKCGKPRAKARTSKKSLGIVNEWWVCDNNYLIDLYRLWQRLIWHTAIETSSWVMIWYDIDRT